VIVGAAAPDIKLMVARRVEIRMRGRDEISGCRNACSSHGRARKHGGPNPPIFHRFLLVRRLVPIKRRGEGIPSAFFCAGI
jgi:hypothetical protein